MAMWTNKTEDRIYVNASKDTIVPEDSEEAAFMLVAPHGQLDMDEAVRLGLADKNEVQEQSEDEGVVVDETEEEKTVELGTSADTKAADKAGTRDKAVSGPERNK